MKLISRLRSIPKLLIPSQPRMSEAKYRFIRGGAIIFPVNFTQGSPYSVQPHKEEELVMIPAMASIPLLDKKISVPVLYGNSIIGYMKNLLTLYMYNYYYRHNPSILHYIYNPEKITEKYGEEIGEITSIVPERNKKKLTAESVAVLSAGIFRLKPPFISVSTASNKMLEEVLRLSVKAVWYNPVFKMFGLGLAPWAPSRSIVSSVAFPVITELSLVKLYAEKLWKNIKEAFAGNDELRDELETLKITPISLSDANEMLKHGEPIIERMVFRGVGEKTVAGVYPIVKLKTDLTEDFQRLGIVPNDNFRIETTGGKYDPVSPTPVKITYGSPMTLISIFSRGTRTSLHTDLELACFAKAMSDIPKYGPNDNVMRIFVYAEFKDINTNNRVVLASATGGIGENYLNKEAENYNRLFDEWLGKVPYDEAITPLSIALLGVHLGNITKSNSGKNK